MPSSLMARHQKYLEGRAIPREQQAADVCGATVFLLSGLARFVTGQLLAAKRAWPGPWTLNRPPSRK